MKKIYHVLSSNIPHHNNTVLQFFEQRLRDKIPSEAMAKFLVVGKDLIRTYPNLNVEEFSSKKEIATALTKIATTDPNVYFYLHGQFNFPIWLAILFNKLPVERITWHIWGADLYEDSNRLIFKLAYPLRRFIQKKLKHVVGTQGDVNAFSRLNPDAKTDVVYFPTKMNRTFQPKVRTIEKHNLNKKLTILLGNSGDHSNRHAEALEQIKAKLGDEVRIIIPMGYPENNNDYIKSLKMSAERLYSKNNNKSAVEIIEDKIAFDNYLNILAECDLGYLIFQRQQGIGTVCLLTQLNIPIVLHRKNTFCEDMQLYQVPFLFVDEVSRENIQKTQEKLTALDKETIGFFDPYFVDTWFPVLKNILMK